MPDDALTRKRARGRRQRAIRSRTINIRRLTQKELAIGRVLYPEDEHADVERPKTRADCQGSSRPCPFVGCEHHLYLDVQPNGSIKLNFPDVGEDHLEELPESCVLDIADKQGVTLEEVARSLNLTLERVRQIESTGLEKIRSACLSGLDLAAEESDERRHLTIIQQPHERLEWGVSREDFDIDRDWSLDHAAPKAH